MSLMISCHSLIFNVFQGMWDMFIRSQHPGTSGCGVEWQHNRQEREFEQQEYSDPNDVYVLDPWGMSVSRTAVHRRNMNNVQHRSPSAGMPWHLASTIQLSDTYQTCGQVVS
jgi:DNA segregation ATPase FtsK/SpoIIIE-like protein